MADTGATSNVIIIISLAGSARVSFARQTSLACDGTSICIGYWQNVLGTHHASAHGGSFDLIVKMLDYI